jgi:hypothetical protein
LTARSCGGRGLKSFRTLMDEYSLKMPPLNVEIGEQALPALSR